MSENDSSRKITVSTLSSFFGGMKTWKRTIREICLLETLVNHKNTHAVHFLRGSKRKWLANDFCSLTSRSIGRWVQSEGNFVDSWAARLSKKIRVDVRPKATSVDSMTAVPSLKLPEARSRAFSGSERHTARKRVEVANSWLQYKTKKTNITNETGSPLIL